MNTSPAVMMRWEDRKVTHISLHMQQLSDTHLLQDLSRYVENRTRRTFNKQYKKKTSFLLNTCRLRYILYTSKTIHFFLLGLLYTEVW